MTLGTDFPEILIAAQAGGQWALSALYRDINPTLVRYLDSRAPGLGEDLAQETWLAIAPKLAAFVGGEMEFRRWMFTIAHRRLIAHWRRAGRRPTADVAPDQLAALAPASTDPDEVSAREAIAELTRGLTDEQVDVVMLRVVVGFSVEEVAAIVGRRPGAVRTMQHRALRRLAQGRSESAVTP